MSKVRQRHSRATWSGHIEVALALLFCALNLVFAAVPVVGMAVLPCLLGSVCWATSALSRAGWTA